MLNMFTTIAENKHTKGAFLPSLRLVFTLTTCRLVDKVTGPSHSPMFRGVHECVPDARQMKHWINAKSHLFGWVGWRQWGFNSLSYIKCSLRGYSTGITACLVASSFQCFRMHGISCLQEPLCFSDSAATYIQADIKVFALFMLCTLGRTMASDLIQVRSNVERFRRRMWIHC